jgi:hypothetical protein
VLNIQFKLKPMMLAVTMACSYWCISGSTYAEVIADKTLKNPDEHLTRAAIVRFNPISGINTEYSVRRKQANHSSVIEQPPHPTLPIVDNNAIEKSISQTTVSQISNSSNIGESSLKFNQDLHDAFSLPTSLTSDKTAGYNFNHLRPTDTMQNTVPEKGTYPQQSFNATLSEALPRVNTAETTDILTQQPNLKAEDSTNNNDLKPAETISKEERLLQQIKAKRKALGLTSDETLILTGEKNELPTTPDDNLNIDKAKLKKNRKQTNFSITR